MMPRLLCDFGIVGLEPDRFAHAGFRFRQAVHGAKVVAQVIVGHRQLRIEFDRLAVTGVGVGEAPWATRVTPR